MIARHTFAGKGYDKIGRVDMHWVQGRSGVTCGEIGVRNEFFGTATPGGVAV